MKGGVVTSRKLNEESEERLGTKACENPSIARVTPFRYVGG